MITVTKIGAKSLAKLFGVMYLVMGLVFGVIMYIVSIVPSLAGESEIPEGDGVVLFFLFTFGYGIIGWIGGYVFAWLYNVVAKHFGGVEIEIDKASE
jgi:uncharacterized membrane protein